MANAAKGGTATLPAAPIGGTYTATVSFSATIQANTDYWFDVTIRNPARAPDPYDDRWGSN